MQVNRERSKSLRENPADYNKTDLNITNKYKTRIIESEINSGLFLQILIYYNFFSAIICFLFEIVAITFKVCIN